LTNPFAARFGATSTVDHVADGVTLLAAAAATGLLIAPVSYHRKCLAAIAKSRAGADRLAVGQAGLACLPVAIRGRCSS
jgi:hypothetical protein